MRTIVKLESIKPAEASFHWSGYCLQIDNLRRKLIPGYDPKQLPEEEQWKDWNNFVKYYTVVHGVTPTIVS